MKKFVSVIVFAVLTLFFLSFIFGMSLQSKEESGDTSSEVAEALKPIVDPDDKIPEKTFHRAVRKAAHFAEFCGLGFCLWGMFSSVGKLCGKRLVTLPFFLSLLSAVADEFIQYFSGRGSMVTDVVLDFCGAVFGIGICALAAVLAEKIKKAKKIKKT